MKCKLRLPQFYFLILFSLLALTSCQTDDGNSGNNDPQNNIPDTFSDYFGNQINRDFLGTVVDVNNQPIEAVTITIGSSMAMTDANGVFFINSATVNERFGYVKAEKTGYIHGSRSVVPSTGVNKVNIMLLEADVAGTTNSGTSETITLSNGSSVALDGNFVKEDGSAYSGSVDVIMHHLDPMDEDMSVQMPGMLYAENQEGAERMLQTLGMLAVELRGTGGEDLNLGNGSSAEIKIPVDPSLMATAPPSIPLWYFDEDNGYWKEEGQAVLVGNMYVGTVTHFSFWNCDIPAEAITLCVSATDDENNPLNNLYVTITSTTFGTTGGYINENGEVCGYVPSGETLELNVYSYEFCSDMPLLTQSIGPFNSDSSITVIIPESNDVISETVTGTFNTCSGDPVSNGYVQVTYGSQTFTDAVTDGSFEINLLRCDEDNTFSIKGSDYVNLQTTGSISYTFTTPLTDVGTISACNAVDEFVQYTIDDNETTIILEPFNVEFAVSGPNVNAPTLYISGFGDGTGGGNTCFYMVGQLNDPDYLGTYDHWDWNDINDTGFNISECQQISNMNNGIIYNLTALGEVGEYVDINFNGTYEDYDGNPHAISGVIHVLRDQ